MKNRIKITKFSLNFLFIFLLIFLCGCGGKTNLKDMNTLANKAYKDGKSLIDQGKVEEGVKMINIVNKLHPNDQSIKDALNKVPANKREILEVNPLLGINKSRMRADITPSKTEKILWYIPDRLKDFIDMVTLEVNFGPQLGAGAWATRAVQTVAYTGGTVGYGYYQKTGIGLRSEGSVDFAAGPVGGTAVAGGRIGLNGMASTASALTLHKPSENIYQDYRDYWGIGGKIGFFFLGGEAEYHPVEIYDFLAGFLLMDPLHDDLATTRRLQYTSEQKKTMSELLDLIKDSKIVEIENYKKQYPTLNP
ncbi:MAG: hypothetical protein HY934_06685 [Candidatus Firestonebacteria bacterium]|nr:hypothetical protein [Candidatus Firestonebacteria bacterium]